MKAAVGGARARKGLALSRGGGVLGEGRQTFSAALPEPCQPDAAQEMSALDEICHGPLAGPKV